MTELNLLCVVGARPNFIKMAPLLRALNPYDHVRVTLLHTGQHYDASLSEVFFDELNIPRPDISLGIGSGKHGEQTGRLLAGIEEVLQSGDANGQPFDRVVVVGDVNSTMAAALAAVKLGIPVAHVEAGLRSFDRSMPEEINRILTDAICDMLLVSEPVGVENLLREGQSSDSIHLVGNIMIDTLRELLPVAQSQDTLARFHVTPAAYGVVTLHRPSNVDDPSVLASLLDVLTRVSDSLPMIFPVHPRTLSRLDEFNLRGQLESAANLIEAPPLGYLDFLALTSQAAVIVTDSGGLQEESTALGVPCLTMRSNTERPITVEMGSSTLIGNDATLLGEQIEAIRKGQYKKCLCPESWDGRTAERIAKLLVGR